MSTPVIGGGVYKRSGEKDGIRIASEPTGNSMISPIFGTDSTVAVAVEARHWLLGEEGERLQEDCRRISMGSNQ